MKNKKRAVAFTLATSILFGASGCTPREKSETPSPSEPILEEQLPKHDKDLVLKYDDLIDEIHVEYKNEDCYLNANTIESINDNEANDNVCTYSYDNLDEALDELVLAIKSNSLNAKEMKDSYKYTLPSEVQKEKDIEIDMDSLLLQALKEVFGTATNNINEDICTLMDCKIFLSNKVPEDKAADYSRNNNRITIYYKHLIAQADAYANIDYFNSSDKSFEELFAFHLKDQFVSTLKHEINHARQNKCKHRNNNFETPSKYAGNNASTFCETTAESAIYNLEPNKMSEKSNYQLSYSEERYDEALFLMMGVTNESMDLYYNCYFDSDFSKLYEFLNIKSKEDMQALFNILYAIDSYNSRSPLTMSRDKNNTSYDYVIGNDYLIDIYKLALKNMVNYTVNHPDFTFNDNANLFLILNNMITNEASMTNYDYTDTPTYGDTFINSFDTLDTYYQNFLIDHYGVNYADIMDAFNNNYINEANLIAMNNDNATNKENIEKASNLLEEFPVLKSILYAHYVIPDAYFDYNSNSSVEKGNTKR